MAVINSGPIEAEDLLRHVPEDKWRELMLARRRFLEIKLSHDCRCLVQFVNDAKLMFEALGFASVENMIREGYGLEPAEIAIAVEWLQLNPPAEPIGIEPVIQQALGPRGRPKKGEEKLRNTYFKSGTDTSAYILARLDSDGHSGLAAKVRAGEMSANQAAIAAGFRKPLTLLERIAKLALKLTDLEWEKLKRAEDQRRHLDKGNAAS